MGMPDLITLEQFVVYNGTQRISGKTMEASSIKNKKEALNMIFDKDYCRPLRQTILIGATSSK